MIQFIKDRFIKILLSIISLLLGVILVLAIFAKDRIIEQYIAPDVLNVLVNKVTSNNENEEQERKEYMDNIGHILNALEYSYLSDDLRDRRYLVTDKKDFADREINSTVILALHNNEYMEKQEYEKRLKDLEDQVRDVIRKLGDLEKQLKQLDTIVTDTAIAKKEVIVSLFEGQKTPKRLTLNNKNRAIKSSFTNGKAYCVEAINPDIDSEKVIRIRLVKDDHMPDESKRGEEYGENSAKGNIDSDNYMKLDPTKKGIVKALVKECP